MKTTVVIVILILSGIAGVVLSAYQHSAHGNNTTLGLHKIHNPTEFAARLRTDPMAGKKIFQAYCQTCHGEKPIIQLRAPRIGDKRGWKLRAKAGKQALLRLTISGFGAMPARGGCFECTDKQLQQALEYLLHNSGVK